MQRALAEIADALRALATTGLHYAENPFDRERYDRALALAARLGALVSDAEPAVIERIYRAADEGYVTPKLDVRMAVFRDERVLLVQERADQRWALPGGFVDIGDSPAEAAVRETAEEAGVDVRAERLVGIFDRRLRPEAPPALFHIHKVIFTGRLVDPDASARAGHEAIDARFFPLDALPELSLGRTLPFHIEAARRVARDPALPALFD